MTTTPNIPPIPPVAPERSTVKKRFKRIIRYTIALVILVLAFCFGHPAFHLARVIWNDRDERQPLPPHTVDDASRLNQTAVQSVIDIPTDPQAAEAQLIALVQRAHQEHLHIAIAGTRHSMGGHSIYPGGMALNMLPFNHMKLDEAASILHVGAGARWADIIPYLDGHGFSVSVMQSFNDFSVGGSLSVNCHGWVYGCPPIAASVQSLHLIAADGRKLNCSRTENSELFSLVLGGYGLFGIILDADLHVVPNARYRAVRSVMPTSGFVAALRGLDVARPPTMLFARLSIAPKSFLDEAVLNTFYPDSGPIPPLTPLTSGTSSTAVRAVYRGAEGNDYGKQLRWVVEKWYDEEIGGTIFSRNQLLNQPFANYENRHSATTDILQEYFLPLDEFTGFVGDLKKIIPTHHADLINATIRDVCRDDITYLHYANGDRLALVLLFVQSRTPTGDMNMQPLTRVLIDAALEHHGSYYLPYRLQASFAQFSGAYPMAESFFTLKRRYDLDEIFQNEFYVHYGRVGVSGLKASH